MTAGIASGKLLPAPSDILLDAWKLFKSGELQKNIGISLFRALLGFIIGGGIGFILGVLNGIFKVCRLAFDNTIQMLRNIPHLALIPLIILVIGIGEPSKIFLVSVGCMFPMYINTYHGVTSIDKGLVEMGRSYGLSNSQVFFKIIFPGALPTILMGVRYALGVMWTTLIVAETVATSSGIGYMAN
ncbi:ABC transporter permease, partial [Oenococcus oeni]